MSTYIHTPDTIKIQDVVNNNYTLSSSQYLKLILPNDNYMYVREFLSRPLSRKDLGIEVGSLNYTEKSPYHFIRTKALQENSFLININDETSLPIMPSEFVQMNLKEGDLLISKDSNIGEIIILDKDYNNCMISGGIYKLPVIEKWRYYLLAFIKHDIFREQLDIMVPKGATIRHAKTKFLDCKIPLPNNNSDRVIQYVTLLTKAIVNKEKCIRECHSKILNLIEHELNENQRPNTFCYQLPRYNNILEIGRLDTGLYNDKYKKLEFILTNYINGCTKLSEKGYRVLRGPNLAVSVIGPTHYAESLLSEKYYKLIQGVDLSEYGTVLRQRFFGNKNKIQLLKEGDILFSAEGSIGKVYITIDLKDRAVTNYHGMSITNPEATIIEKCFIGCFFFWLRKKGWFDYYSVGGQGGSFGKEKTENLLIPNFPDEKQREIALLYHNDISYNLSDATFDNFIELDDKYNLNAGIYELDKSKKILAERLNKTIDSIINCRNIDIVFP